MKKVLLLVVAVVAAFFAVSPLLVHYWYEASKSPLTEGLTKGSKVGVDEEILNLVVEDVDGDIIKTNKGTYIINHEGLEKGDIISVIGFQNINYHKDRIVKSGVYFENCSKNDKIIKISRYNSVLKITTPRQQRTVLGGSYLLKKKQDGNTIMYRINQPTRMIEKV
jgi:hypothetical protein